MSKFALEHRDYSFTKKFSIRSGKISVTAEILRLRGTTELFLHTVMFTASGANRKLVGISFPSSVPRRVLLEELVDFLGDQFARGLDRIETPMFGIENTVFEKYSLTDLEATQQAVDKFFLELDNYDLDRDEYCFSLGCYLGCPTIDVDEIVTAVRGHVRRWKEKYPLAKYRKDPLQSIEDNMQFWNPLCAQWGYTTYKTLTNNSRSIVVTPEVVSHCQDSEYRDFLNIFTRIPSSIPAIDRVIGEVRLTELEAAAPLPHLSTMPLHYPQFRSYLKSLTVAQLYRKYPKVLSMRNSNNCSCDGESTPPMLDLPHSSLSEVQAGEELRTAHLEAISTLIRELPGFGYDEDQERWISKRVLRYLGRFENDTYVLGALRAHLETGVRSITQLDVKLSDLHWLFYVPSPLFKMLSRAPLDYVAFRLTQLTRDPARTFDILIESENLGGDIDTWEAYFASWDTVREMPVSIALDLLSGDKNEIVGAALSG